MTISWEICLGDLVLIRNCLKRICQETPEDYRHDITRVLTDIEDRIKKEITKCAG